MTRRSRCPDRGDLVWVDFSPQAGHEQAGRRPAIVVSPRAYNERSNLAILCPVTTRSKGYGFEVHLPAGLAVEGVILADQARSMDWRARNTVVVGTVPTEVTDDVLAKLATLVS